MNKEEAIEFLEQTAIYFENRETKGEDLAFWSNVYNSKNIREIANLIKKLNHKKNT